MSAPNEMTPEQLCERLNAYDGGKGWRGQHWHLTDEATHQGYIISDWLLDVLRVADAAAIVAGMDAMEEIAALKAERQEIVDKEKRMDTTGFERDAVIAAAKIYFLDRGSSTKQGKLWDATLALLTKEIGCEYCAQEIPIEPLFVGSGMCERAHRISDNSDFINVKCGRRGKGNVHRERNDIISSTSDNA